MNCLKAHVQTPGEFPVDVLTSEIRRVATRFPGGKSILSLAFLLVDTTTIISPSADCRHGDVMVDQLDEHHVGEEAGLGVLPADCCLLLLTDELDKSISREADAFEF